MSDLLKYSIEREKKFKQEFGFTFSEDEMERILQFNRDTLSGIIKEIKRITWNKLLDEVIGILPIIPPREKKGVHKQGFYEGQKFVNTTMRYRLETMRRGESIKNNQQNHD